MTSVEDFIHSCHAADAVRARVRPVLGHGSAFEVHGQAYTWVGWPAFLTLHAACVAFPVFVLRATTGLLRARRSSSEGGSARQIRRRAANAPIGLLFLHDGSWWSGATALQPGDQLLEQCVELFRLPKCERGRDSLIVRDVPGDRCGASSMAAKERAPAAIRAPFTLNSPTAWAADRPTRRTRRHRDRLDAGKTGRKGGIRLPRRTARRDRARQPIAEGARGGCPDAEDLWTGPSAHAWRTDGVVRARPVRSGGDRRRGNAHPARLPGSRAALGR